jgi:DNA-binding XRE family transcriptional regulator
LFFAYDESQGNLQVGRDANEGDEASFSKGEGMVRPHGGSTREFAKRLRQYRDEMNWTRQALAQQMDVSVATIGNWERGKGFPAMKMRKNLCTLLGTTAEALHLPPYNEDYD